MSTLTRRRFIGISAAASGLALLPLGPAPAAAEAVRWRGVALGAPAEMVLHHPDRAAAERLVARSVAELARLERIFSLYRADSALSRLNAQGFLADPPAELVTLLEASHRFHALSGGLFDPTVQPLWQLLARHFAMPGADTAGPAREEMAAALALVGLDRVAFNRDRIVFRRPGMALTLNGIAQGFITDRIVTLLRAGGVTRTLADLGEIRVLGIRPDGTPWRIGLAGEALPLIDQAVATSSAEGFRFAGPQTPGHILDPMTGASAVRHASVSVIAPEAATADALSTAFSLMAPERIAPVLALVPGVEVRLVAPDGRRLVLT